MDGCSNEEAVLETQLAEPWADYSATYDEGEMQSCVASFWRPGEDIEHSVFRMAENAFLVLWRIVLSANMAARGDVRMEEEDRGLMTSI